ncbi:uncharacterized protein BT62DRAFT_651208 [Guyanagaster necrorhizus]|uniref:Uncharacterized protein n=1 Tax=Guyanagaster necrorhizus TaxID=856835 RepID=A0A9P8ALN5_9AGAR|nr:uncharacterized protein BT62DRAFT_651208 [Guyanagaster necrorhizus MCA 3950]KAG7439894.1 hypothetical protein BT62DRAFT_651208 [Guyanagaster necrorhizus MCA 3950]
MLTLNFVVNTAVQETNTETTSATPSAPSTIFSSPTARSIVPIPSDTPEPSSSPLASTSNRTAIIAGSVCGSLGLVAIMTGISICLYRRRDAASNEAFPDQQPYYTTTAQPYTITTTPTSTMMPSKISASEVPRDAALTVRQAMLRDRAEGLQAQVAILRQNKTEGRLMEENERQRQQIASLERQMTYLMEQQRSAWALGYTNEPPPSYMSGSSNGIS